MRVFHLKRLQQSLKKEILQILGFGVSLRGTPEKQQNFLTTSGFPLGFRGKMLNFNA